MLKKIILGICLILIHNSSFAYIQSYVTFGEQTGEQLHRLRIEENLPANYVKNNKVEFRLITAGTYQIPTTEYINKILHSFKTWEDVDNCKIEFQRGTDITTDTVPDPENSSKPIQNSDFSIGFTDAVFDRASFCE